MGVVNVTPDSFSDGGKFLKPRAAIDRSLKLIDEGADLIDIGGESTRPFSRPVSHQEELRRVVPVIRTLCAKTSIPVSIDTSKAAVARAALDAGAEVINDVTALKGDTEMVGLAVDSGAGLCVMHMQGTPQTMQENPTYDDVVSEVATYLAGRRDALLESGVRRDKICLDPGIGFGKSHQHNLTLLAECHRLHQLGCPLLVGHSRKSFISKVLEDQDSDRKAGTIGVAMALASQGVQILRVHDVGPVVEALMLFQAVGGIDGRCLQLDRR
jgi:dihydropteroate synthase